MNLYLLTIRSNDEKPLELCTSSILASTIEQAKAVYCLHQFLPKDYFSAIVSDYYLLEVGKVATDWDNCVLSRQTN